MTTPAAAASITHVTLSSPALPTPTPSAKHTPPPLPLTGPQTHKVNMALSLGNTTTTITNTTGISSTCSPVVSSMSVSPGLLVATSITPSTRRTSRPSSRSGSPSPATDIINPTSPILETKEVKRRVSDIIPSDGSSRPLYIYFAQTPFAGKPAYVDGTKREINASFANHPLEVLTGAPFLPTSITTNAAHAEAHIHLTTVRTLLSRVKEIVETSGLSISAGQLTTVANTCDNMEGMLKGVLVPIASAITPLQALEARGVQNLSDLNHIFMDFSHILNGGRFPNREEVITKLCDLETRINNHQTDHEDIKKKYSDLQEGIHKEVRGLNEAIISHRAFSPPSSESELTALAHATERPNISQLRTSIQHQSELQKVRVELVRDLKLSAENTTLSLIKSEGMLNCLNNTIKIMKELEPILFDTEEAVERWQKVALSAKALEQEPEDLKHKANLPGGVQAKTPSRIVKSPMDLEFNILASTYPPEIPTTTGNLATILRDLIAQKEGILSDITKAKVAKGAVHTLVETHITSLKERSNIKKGDFVFTDITQEQSDAHFEKEIQAIQERQNAVADKLVQRWNSLTCLQERVEGGVKQLIERNTALIPILFVNFFIEMLNIQLKRVRENHKAVASHRYHYANAKSIFGKLDAIIRKPQTPISNVNAFTLDGLTLAVIKQKLASEFVLPTKTGLILPKGDARAESESEAMWIQIINALKNSDANNKEDIKAAWNAGDYLYVKCSAEIRRMSYVLDYLKPKPTDETICSSYPAESAFNDKKILNSFSNILGGYLYDEGLKIYEKSPFVA